MTWVKICGVQDIATAKVVEAAGGNAIGLMFAESPRQLSLGQARDITQSLGKAILKIGVFVNAESAAINAAVARCHLDMVQLHGDEPPAQLAEIRVPVIKAFRIGNEADFEALLPYSPFGFLLDSKVVGSRGGTGHAFDWQLLARQKLTSQIIVAGGLTVDNVALALSITGAFGVDVSSGVESNGVKDEAKIRLFIERARLKHTC